MSTTTRLAARLHALDLQRARRDPAWFVHRARGYDRHPETGARGAVEIAPFHQRWHDACSAHDRLVVWAPIEHGKTEQISIGRIVWELGTNPKATVLILSGSGQMAEKIGGAIRREIEHNTYVRQVFPSLRPSTGRTQKWTDKAFRIAGAPPGQKDPSVQCIGVGGPVLGSRLSLVVLDDVLTKDNTITSYQRQKVADWFFAMVSGRLLPEARVWVFGNAWYGDDLMHTLVDTSHYHGIREPAYRETAVGGIDPASILWPRRWPLARLEKWLRNNPIYEARRQLQSQRYAAGQSKFEEAWFDEAFRSGARYRFVRTYVGWPTFCGVDLGASEREGSDQTCFFIIAVDPDTQARLPIWVQTERLTAPAIIATMVDLERRYGCLFMVENVAAQIYIEQFAREKGVRVRGFTTGKNKADPRYGMPSLATELAQGLWLLPEEAELYTWKQETMNWSPGSHAGDRLMASWFARECARQSLIILQGERDEDEPTATVARADYRGPLRGRYTPQSARPSRPRGWGRIRLVS